MFVLFRNYIYISKKKNYESETGSRNINFLRLQEEWDLGVKLPVTQLCILALFRPHSLQPSHVKQLFQYI